MCVLGCYKLFHDGGFYHIETSPLTCKANQWTGFYMIGTSVMKELKLKIGWLKVQLRAIANETSLCVFLKKVLLYAKAIRFLAAVIANYILS